MVFSLVLFGCSWIIFFIFGDRKLVKNYLPTCYVGMILGLATDIMTDVYDLWSYPAMTDVQSFWRHFLDDFGVYFVVTYLFLQTLPKLQTIIKVVLHIFVWSFLAIGLELFAHQIGTLKYGHWWNSGYSYASDWVLFVLFYFHHKWINK